MTRIQRKNEMSINAVEFNYNIWLTRTYLYYIWERRFFSVLLPIIVIEYQFLNEHHLLYFIV